MTFIRPAGDADAVHVFLHFDRQWGSELPVTIYREWFPLRLETVKWSMTPEEHAVVEEYRARCERFDIDPTKVDAVIVGSAGGGISIAPDCSSVLLLIPQDLEHEREVARELAA